jgi:integrase
MRGSLVNRGKNRWALVLDKGYEVDPVTQRRKRIQKWVSFHGTKKQAGDKLTELVRAVNRDEFVEPSKLTLGGWLDQWLLKIIKPARRMNTHKTYHAIIEHSVKPSIGMIPLQRLKLADLQQYVAAHAHLAPTTLRLHHSCLSAALKSAVKNGLVVRNVARDVEGLPKVERSADSIEANVLSVDDARALLASAKDAGPRSGAFYALALDSGARLGELGGLKWSDIDLDNSKISIVRQLVSPTLTAEGAVQFGPPKTGKSRVVDLSADTVTLLRAHKKHQAEVKLKNRSVYHDHALVFAKECADLSCADDALGTPLRLHNINTQELKRLLSAAGLRRITFHGLRHTSATLLLQAGVSVKIVSERLGHSKVSMTLDTYSHVLPSMGRGAADKLGALLHG